jgi:hypothetical protein
VIVPVGKELWLGEAGKRYVVRLQPKQLGICYLRQIFHILNESYS